ncbi:MAG: hypothetical protein H6711_06355 [Myxococcales bacterium]|nr:hypothetical protein [Myxococcales bacterium]
MPIKVPVEPVAGAWGALGPAYPVGTCQPPGDGAAAGDGTGDGVVGGAGVVVVAGSGSEGFEALTSDGMVHGCWGFESSDTRRK